MKETWTKPGSEPAIAEMLADPIVQSLMKADHVTRGDVLTVSADAADRTARRRQEPRRLIA